MVNPQNEDLPDYLQQQRCKLNYSIKSGKGSFCSLTKRKNHSAFIMLSGTSSF